MVVRQAAATAHHARSGALGGVVVIICGLLGGASSAQQQSPQEVAQGADEGVWIRFAEDMAEASGVPYTADALRELIPAATTADIAWARAYADLNKKALAAMTATTARDLLEAVEMRVSLKIVADVVGTGHGRPLETGEAGWAELNEALWSRYAAELAAAQHIRDAVPDVSAADVLWVLGARHFDRSMLREGVPADELLRLPAYQLARNHVVDALVRSMVNCVRCANPNASYYNTSCMVFDALGGNCQANYDIAERACDFGDAVCRLNPIGSRAPCAVIPKACLCVADCNKCSCLGGILPNNCYDDCHDGDLEHDCVPRDGTFDHIYGPWPY